MCSNNEYIIGLERTSFTMKIFPSLKCLVLNLAYYKRVR